MINQTGANYLSLLNNIMTNGTQVKPRGMDIMELEDAQVVINPMSPFLVYKSRNYPISYFKKEMRWKLTANKYDTSIQNEAKIWKDVINPDGTYNSNYGQYWFGEQQGFWGVVTELMRDNDSRRAVIPMLNASHLAPHVKDTVCTECIGFRLREANGCPTLNMSVHMRSSDVIYGLGTDIPTFAFLYRLVLAFMMDYLTVCGVGTITITSMSSHIYSTHYNLVKEMLDIGLDGYNYISMPTCDNLEAMRIIASRGNQMLLHEVGPLGRWLCD